MKNVLFVLSMLFVFAFAGMSFATADTSLNTPEEVVVLAEENEATAEEALHCKIEKEGTTIECWFCNCRALAQSIK